MSDELYEVEWSETGVIERITWDEITLYRRLDDAGDWTLRRAGDREWATCGHCERTWADDHVTGITPTPSGRCPFEYDHEYDDDL